MKGEIGTLGRVRTERVGRDHHYLSTTICLVHSDLLITRVTEHSLMRLALKHSRGDRLPHIRLRLRVLILGLGAPCLCN